MSEYIVKQEEVFPTYFAAADSEQMAKAQEGLITWAERRVQSSHLDKLELQRALTHAEDNKWNTKVLRRHLLRSEKVWRFYQKVLFALKAGLVLVPAFPIDVFAIRTAKGSPKQNSTVVKEGHDANSNASVHSEVLPAGEGEYKSDEAARLQSYSHTAKEKDYQGKEVEKHYYHFYNDEFKDVAFPMIACKPEVMSATALAMTKKIFDEIGVSHDEAGRNSRFYQRGDPLVIGAIYGPGPTWSRKKVHFLISWHVNLNDL